MAVLACKIKTDPDQPVAIEIVLPDSGRVELPDTFRPRGRALNGLGDSVPADLLWSSLDTATIAVLDSTTGVSLSKAVGIGRLEARTANLFSNPQSVSVLAHLDSVRADSATRDTVKLKPDSTEHLDSLSIPLKVQAFATGGTAERRRVVYVVATTFPTTGPVVTLVPNDTVLTSAGIAAVRLRVLPGARADSVVVTATMKRLDGTEIAGSPVRFVVEYGP